MGFEYFAIGFIAGATVLSMLATHEMDKIHDKYEKMLDNIRKTEER